MTDEQERTSETALILARNLEAVRRFRGFLKKEVARKLGVSHGTIANWERQPPKGCPSMVQGAQIADLYGVSLDALVGRAPLELTVKPRKEES